MNAATTTIDESGDWALPPEGGAWQARGVRPAARDARHGVRDARPPERVGDDVDAEAESAAQLDLDVDADADADPSADAAIHKDATAPDGLGPPGPTARGRRGDAASIAVAVTEAQLAEWIDAVADQDERALAALYDATFTRVFGLVRRIVRDTGLAEEVVEDAYFQVWRQALRFDPARGKALAWLLSIARSRAIDALRREARFEHEPLEAEGHAAIASTTPLADELLDLARHRGELHEALMRLGAQPRQMVSLSFLRGLSHEEIAEQMGLPLGTVKSQIRRALQALRQLLGEAAAPRLAS